MTIHTYIRSVPSLSDCVIAPTDGVHRRESAETGPVVLNILPVAGAAYYYSGTVTPWTHFVRPFFPTPIIINDTVGMRRKMPTAMIVSRFRVNGGTAINITGYNAEIDCPLPTERLRYLPCLLRC